MDSKLSQDGTDDVDVEDVGLRTFLAQALNHTGARDAEEADRHEHTTDGVLRVAKLDTLKVQDRQGVSGDKTVESENLVHLNGGNESATALSDNVGHGNNVSQLRGERSSNRGVTKLQSGWLIISKVGLHHARRKLVGKSSRLGVDLGLTSGTRVRVDELLGTGRGDGLESVALRLGVLLGSDVLPLGLALDGLLELRVGGARRIQVGNHGGNRGRGLVEACHQLDLLLIHLLHLAVASVFGDAGKILGSSVQESNTNVSLLQGTDVVGAVTSHQSVVTHILETQKNILLLLGRNTSVDPSVSEERVPGSLVLELGEGVTSNTDILGAEDLGVKRLGRINLDADLVIDALPHKLLTTSVVLGGIENEDLTVNDLDLAGDVNSGKRVVSGNHDHAVAALVQHLNSLLGIVLEGAVQHEEAGKSQVTLNLLSLQVIDSSRTQFRVHGKLLVGEGQNTRTLASKVLVGLFVIAGDSGKHLLDSLGRTLDTGEGAPNLVTSLDIVAVNHGDRALTLEGRRELESTLDLDGTVGAASLVCAHEGVVSAKSPAERSKSGLFHGVTNNLSFIKLDQGVGGGKNQLGLQAGLGDGSHGRVGAIGLLGVLDLIVSQSKTGNTLNDEVLTSQSTSLVETGHIDAASKGNTEGLGTEDGKLGESGQTGVDRKTKLHGKLRGNNAGDNQDAVQHELGALAILADTLVPDIPGGGNGEDEEEQNEEESLGVVGRDSLGGVDHGSHQVSLGSLETGLHDDSHGAVVRRRGNTGREPGLLLIRISVGDLEDLGASPEESVLIKTLSIQGDI